MNIEDKFELWKEASNDYYNGEDPIIPDTTFDDLQEELLNCGNEEIIRFIKQSINKNNGSFENIPQGSNNDAGMQVSLKKIKWSDYSSAIEITKFFGRESRQYYISPKFDGCSLKICINGGSNIITTRGGQDVTEKMLNVKGIKESIEKYGGDCKYIVGELLIEKDIFNELYSDDFENPRNFVAGILNKSENSKFLADLVFIPYTDGTNPLLKESCWKSISGILTSDLRNIDITGYFSNLKSDSYPYLCDGIVLAYTTDNRVLKDNYPLNMVAVKFPSERAHTKVLSIEWSQKKSKKLTPILHVEPTRLDGSTISKCSGYNYKYLKNNHIGVGAIVEITKSGDIIPVVVKTIKYSDIITFPEVKFHIRDKHLIVDDDDDISKSTKFYNAFKVLDIKNIGYVLSDKIAEIVNYDIFSLFDPEVKESWAFKIDPTSMLYCKLLEINNITILKLSDIIYMLQFDNVGMKISKKISLVLSKKSTDVENISSDIRNNVMRGEGFKKILDTIGRLKKYGIKVIMDDNSSMTYEMTGEPTNGMNKNDFSKLLESNAKNMNIELSRSTLSKSTTYLITNNMTSNSSKMVKARKYNIQIITYEDILSKYSTNVL